MKATTRALIQVAKARADHHDRKAAARTLSVSASPALVDELMQATRWYTFTEIAERFHVGYSYVSRSLAGRPGVAKFGSDYRVPEVTLRARLTEALAKNQDRKRAA